MPLPAQPSVRIALRAHHAQEAHSLLLAFEADARGPGRLAIGLQTKWDMATDEPFAADSFAACELDEGTTQLTRRLLFALDVDRLQARPQLGTDGISMSGTVFVDGARHRLDAWSPVGKHLDILSLLAHLTGHHLGAPWNRAPLAGLEAQYIIGARARRLDAPQPVFTEGLVARVLLEEEDGAISFFAVNDALIALPFEDAREVAEGRPLAPRALAPDLARALLDRLTLGFEPSSHPRARGLRIQHPDGEGLRTTAIPWAPDAPRDADAVYDALRSIGPAP